MATIVHRSLPTVTTTRIKLGPGQTVSAYDFLRGLRRPKSKDTATSASARIVPSILDSNGESLVEVAGAVSSEGSGRPEAGYDRAREAEDLRGDDFGSSEAPKVTQTYAKRVKLTPLQGKASREPSPSFCSQGPREDEDERELEGYFQSRNDTLNSTHNGRSVCSNETSDGITRTSLPAPDNHCMQHIPKQQSHVTIATDSEKSSKNRKRRARNEKSKRKGRKKRRVPMDELELMPNLPADAESPEASKVRPSSKGCLQLGKTRELTSTAG